MSTPPAEASPPVPARLRNFCADPTIAALKLHQFTREIIVRRLLDMAATGMFSAATCNAHNNHVAAINELFGEAVRAGLIAANPAAGLRLPAAKRARPLVDVIREERPADLQGSWHLVAKISAAVSNAPRPTKRADSLSRLARDLRRLIDRAEALDPEMADLLGEDWENLRESA